MRTAVSFHGSGKGSGRSGKGSDKAVEGPGKGSEKAVEVQVKAVNSQQKVKERQCPSHVPSKKTWASSDALAMPSAGYSTIGSSEVTGSGTNSVTHLR